MLSTYSHVRILCRSLIVVLIVEIAGLETDIWMVINFVLVIVWKQTFLVCLKAVSENLPEGAENKALMLVSFRRELVVEG